MAHLFIVEGHAVIPTPEVLLISPFKEIWEEDTDPEKFKALAKFKYMEFMTSVLKTNPYKGYTGGQRETKVREACGIPLDAWLGDHVQEGMAMIEEFQVEASESYQFYLAALKAANGIKNFFSEPGILQKVNPKTFAPLYKPKDITGALKDTEAVLTSLKTLKTKVEEEVYAAKKIRSDKKISPFARKASFNQM